MGLCMQEGTIDRNRFVDMSGHGELEDHDMDDLG